MKRNVGRSKYNVSKDKTGRTYDGIVFDSVLEMRYYRDCVLPALKSGELTNCERQKKYILQEGYYRINDQGKRVKMREIDYVADFVLTYEDGRVLVVDTKGMPDSVALMKRKMFWYLYPELPYIWMAYSAKYGGWIPYEELKRLQKNNKKKRESNDNGS